MIHLLWAGVKMLTEKRTVVFDKWFCKLPDNAQDVVGTYINRLLLENFSNSNSAGKGVSELKIDFQKGYRVYFTILNNKEVLLLLAGGTKGGNQKQQQKDIALAIEIRDYLKQQGVI